MREETLQEQSQDSIQAILDDIPRWPSTKDTARWCKGRVGIPHQYEWKPSHDWPDWPYERQFCNVCGRHGKHRVSPKALVKTAYR